MDSGYNLGSCYSNLFIEHSDLLSSLKYDILFIGLFNKYFSAIFVHKKLWLGETKQTGLKHWFL